MQMPIFNIMPKCSLSILLPKASSILLNEIFPFLSCPCPGQLNGWTSQSVSQWHFLFQRFQRALQIFRQRQKTKTKTLGAIEWFRALGQSWLFQTNWETPITTLSLRVIDRRSESDLDNNRNSGDVFIIYCEMQVFRCYLGFCSLFLPAPYWWFWHNRQPLQVKKREQTKSCEMKLRFSM